MRERRRSLEPEMLAEFGQHVLPLCVVYCISCHVFLRVPGFFCQPMLTHNLHAATTAAAQGGAHIGFGEIDAEVVDEHGQQGIKHG